jgi:hypothetical protein
VRLWYLTRISRMRWAAHEETATIGKSVGPGCFTAATKGSAEDQLGMTISRREFIGRIAQAGGYRAAFMAMHSLPLLGVVESELQKECRVGRRRLRDAARRIRLHRAGSA